MILSFLHLEQDFDDHAFVKALDQTRKYEAIIDDKWLGKAQSKNIQPRHFNKPGPGKEGTMNYSLNSSSNATTVLNPPRSNTDSGINPVIRISHVIICVTAILGNTLTIVMFSLERKLLKKSYNILILTLAIADVLTAIMVITSPAYVLGDTFRYPTNHTLAEIVCRLIWSRGIIFQLVFFSVYITLVLTAERWCAVVKPHRYNDVFSRKRVLGYILFSWVWSFLLVSKHISDTVYTPSSEKICQFETTAQGSFIHVLLYGTQISLKTLFPCLAIIGLYIHMIVKINKSPVASAESKAKLRGKMTRMVAATGFILIILYIPNQIVLFLAAAGKAKLDTPLHHFSSLLTFITTCSNPFIYGLSNKNYHQRYRKILFAMCPRALGSGARVEDINLE